MTLLVLFACRAAQAADALENSPFKSAPHPACEPAPPDNSLKGFVPYLRADKTFPHSMEGDYTEISSVMTGPMNFNGPPFAARFVTAESVGLAAVADSDTTANGPGLAPFALSEMQRARDLRLRFELGGASGRSVPPLPSEAEPFAFFRAGELSVQLAVPHAVFGTQKPRWQVGGKAKVSWLDLVLYSGPEREFRLGEWETAALGIAVRLARGQAPPPAVTAAVSNDHLALEWDSLRLSVPLRPDPLSNLQRQVQFETPKY